MFDLIYRFDPANTDAPRAPQTWQEACRLLVQGNRDFAEMTDANQAERETRIIPIDPRAVKCRGSRSSAGVPYEIELP